VIADVSGKGVPAALLMAVTRTIVRNLASTGLSPAQIVDRANTMLIQDTGASMFVTMFLCQFNTASGKITYVNAGHPRPYRLGNNGFPRQFGEVTAALMGVSPPAELGPFAQREDRLEVGQTLLLYTDGVTEARAPDGAMLRDPGLQQLLARDGDGDVEQLCRRLVDSLNQYQRNQPADDITLVALRRRGESIPSP
jgi:sigma-B regulation protein RsbU (phosphoserine phosphatase)